MVVTDLVLYKTPLSIDGEDKFFPDTGNSRIITKANYAAYLANNFSSKSFRKSEFGTMGINVGDNFYVYLPISFENILDYNYAKLEAGAEVYFYYIKPENETNSIGNLKVNFIFDYLIEYCYDIRQFSNRIVFKERSHIHYIDRSTNTIDSAHRTEETYNKPTIDTIEPPLYREQMYDVLWYDIQVTRFMRQTFGDKVDYDSGLSSYGEFTESQNYSENFSSTYHLFRPKAVYERGTKNIVQDCYFSYFRELYDESSGIAYETIEDLSSINFRDTTSNIVNVQLTFNPPFEYVFIRDDLNRLDIQINAYGSPIKDVDETLISPKHLIYKAREKVDYFDKEYIFSNVYNLEGLSSTYFLNKSSLISTSPYQRIANLNCYNLVFNNSVIPIYTEDYEKEFRVHLRIYPKDTGAQVEMKVYSGNTLIFNSQNLPVYFNRVGTIPITVSQYQAYKIANGNRIKSNYVLKAIDGAVDIVSARGKKAKIGETVEFGLDITKQVIKDQATFADLKNLISVTGESAENSMEDVFYQDRLLVTKTRPVLEAGEDMFTFCFNYHKYGALINRADNFLSFYEKLPRFMYIKTVGLDLPLSCPFVNEINKLFDRGVRLWKCIDSSFVEKFDPMVTNFEEE